MYSLMEMVAGLTVNVGPFCSKDFSSAVSSFLERLISHLSWIFEEAEQVMAVLKVLVVLEAILEVVVEALEVTCLSFTICVFLYCRNLSPCYWRWWSVDLWRLVITFLLQRCLGVFGVSVWRWLILILVHLFLLWMSEYSDFFIMACSNLLHLHLICKVFGVTLFARHLRLKPLSVLD